MNKKIIIILFLASTAVLATVLSYAMDYPHNASKSVGCEDCHYIWGSEPSLMIEGLSYGNNIDDTQYNALCWSCHQPLDATPVETHSSLQIDNGYGDWSFECIECHDAHGNYQFRTYGASSYIAQDTVAAVNATTLTRTATTPVWADDQFQGMLLVPNIAYDYNNYLITGNDNTTITVEGTIDLSKVTALVDTFAVVYSNMVKSTIATPNSGNKTVKLFNSDGPNSFADADAAYDGICEVCHTQTTYHRNDVSGDHTHNAGLDCMTCHQHTKGFSVACDICHGNPPVVNTATGGPDGLANDPGVTGSATAGAHNVHVNTKSYGCVVCHYDSVGTGATHKNGSTVTMGFYLFNGAEQGGSYDGQSAVSYNATTTAPVTSVSSNNNKTCSSVYCHSTGQSTVNGGITTPTYASPVWDDPATGVCGTCHKVEELLGLSSGSHEAHLETTGVLGCAECHTGAENDASAYNSSNHVNNSIDVANSYDAGGSPGNGYGKCSTGRCHDDGLGNAKLTPQWGNPGGGCSECHAEVPITGSHVKHVTTTNYNTAECGDCHDAAVRDTTPPAQHIDGNVDVYDTNPGDLNYPQDVAKGGVSYDSCSTAYCHSPGQASDGGPSAPAYATVTWGDTAACGTCHEVNVGSVTSGSHNEHLNAAGVNGCGDCHTGAADNASAYNSTNHVDGSIDVANTYSLDGTPGNGYGTCSAASCHDDGTGTLVATSEWGTDDANCESCHDAAPATGSHTEHLSANRVCAECHKGAVEDTTAPVEHRDDDIDVYETNPGDLNYTTDKAKGSAYSSCSSIYCHGNYNGSGLNASPTWGTAASGACGTCHGASNTAYPASGSHERHAGDAQWTGSVGNQNERDYACIMCHKDIVSGTGPSSYTIADNTKHVNTTVDWAFDTADARLSGSSAYSIASGTQAPTDGTTPRSFGTCSNIYCHSNVQPNGGVGAPDIYTDPTWGTETKCFGCHTDSTTYSNPTDSNQAEIRHIAVTSGSHSKHIRYSYPGYERPTECFACHNWSGTQTGFQSACFSFTCHGNAGEKTFHVNKSVDILFGTLVGTSPAYNGTPAPGDGYDTCSNVYCHSDGTRLRTGATSYTNTTPAWGSGPVSCNSCHGNTDYPSPNDGMPNYANGSPKENSHAKHVIDNNINCGRCHYNTTQDGITIASSANHVSYYSYMLSPNGSYAGTAISFSYVQPNTSNIGRCNSISCHGGNNATWGATLGCEDCHLGTGDLDDYTYGDGNHARVDTTEWTSTGHGKAGAALGCDYCHDSSVNHNTGTNPFRLVNNNVNGNGWNDACYVCHKTGSAGYDPGSGNKTSSVKIDKYHQLAAHSQSGNNGGTFCWDCHDPHGDSNIKMIQARPAKTTDGTYGIPSATPSTDVVFTDNTTGTGAGGFARTSGTFEEGICNTCHTASASSPKMQHYTGTSSDSHNSGQVCTICHNHSGDTTIDGNAFEGSGDCNSCHAYPPAIGDGKSYRTVEMEGKGAHAKHVNHLESLWGGTLNAGTDQFGSGASWTNVCGVCHNGATHDIAEAIPGTGRTIAFPAAYQFGPGTFEYKGDIGTSSGTTLKSCSNINCHFRETPGWQDPATAGN